MKTIILLLLPLICFLTIGCSDDDIKTATESATEHTGFSTVGDLVEINLNINSLAFEEDEASTRAEQPIQYEPDNEKELAALELENVLRTFWIFEFDQESGSLISAPYYNNRGHDSGSETFYKVPFSNNLGNPVIFYVVVNADGRNEVSDWVTPETTTTTDGETITTYPGFMTIDELEAQILPTTYEYESTTLGPEENWPPYYARAEGNEWTTGIPKCGKIEDVIVTKDMQLDVDVKNMYAKILVYWNCDSTTQSTYGFNIVAENIPCYCRVGALADAKTTTAFQYPDSVRWTYTHLAAIPRGYTSPNNDYKESTTGFPPLFILYVPENIQGENGNSSERDENVPPLSETELENKTYDDPSATAVNPSAELVGVSDKTNALAVHFFTSQRLNWYGPIYPGGNNTTNFNVRRNYSYRVIFDFLGVE